MARGSPEFSKCAATRKKSEEMLGNVGGQLVTPFGFTSKRTCNHLHEPKAELDKLVVEQSFELDDYAIRDPDRASVILHQLDWEAFGMENCTLLEEECSSLSPESQSLSTPHLHQSDDQNSTTYQLGASLLCGGSLVPRIHGFVDPTEFMHFADKGLLLDNETLKVLILLRKHPSKVVLEIAIICLFEHHGIDCAKFIIVAALGNWCIANLGSHGRSTYSATDAVAREDMKL